MILRYGKGGDEADAVVFHDSAHALIRQTEQHVDARGLGVKRHVGQRFLDDAEQRRFDLDRESFILHAHGFEFHGDMVLAWRLNS